MLVKDESRGRVFRRFAKRYVTAVAGASYALTLGIRESRHRALIHQIARHFGYREGMPPRLPTVSINQVTASSTPIVLPEPIAQDGNVTLLELTALARLVREREPRRIFEIGTFDGRTTLTLAANAPDDAVVETLDLPRDMPTRLAIERADRSYVDKPQSGSRFHGTTAARKITQLYGD